MTCLPGLDDWMDAWITMTGKTDLGFSLASFFDYEDALHILTARAAAIWWSVAVHCMNLERNLGVFSLACSFAPPPPVGHVIMVIFPAHLSYNLCAVMYTNYNPCDPPCGIALSAELMIAFGGGYGYLQTLLVSSCENVWELKIVLRYSDQYSFWQWKISITNLTKI